MKEKAQVSTDISSEFDAVAAEAANSPASFFRRREGMIREAMATAVITSPRLEELQWKIDATRLASANPGAGLVAIAGLLDDHLAALSACLGRWHEAIAEGDGRTAVAGGPANGGGADFAEDPAGNIFTLIDAIDEARAKLACLST